MFELVLQIVGKANNALERGHHLVGDAGREQRKQRVLALSLLKALALGHVVEGGDEVLLPVQHHLGVLQLNVTSLLSQFCFYLVGLVGAGLSKRLQKNVQHAESRAVVKRRLHRVLARLKLEPVLSERVVVLDVFGHDHRREVQLEQFLEHRVLEGNPNLSGRFNSGLSEFFVLNLEENYGVLLIV